MTSRQETAMAVAIIVILAILAVISVWLEAAL